MIILRYFFFFLREFLKKILLFFQIHFSCASIAKVKVKK